MISARQIRIARAALELSQIDVGMGVGMTDKKLSRLESGVTEGTADDLNALRRFFENRGLEFIEGDGARLRQELITYRDGDGFRCFMDDVYEVAAHEGGDIRLHNARPANWIKWVGQEWWDHHIARMQRARAQTNYHFRITARMGDYNFIAGTYAEYRWVPDALFNQKSFYAYGDRLALLDFTDEAVEVVVIRRRDFAEGFRKLFDAAWEAVSIVPDSPTCKPEDE